MSTTVSIDPGAYTAGVGVFHNHTLVRSQYVKVSNKMPLAERAAEVARQVKALAPQAAHVVVEIPRVYPVSKGDPNDLIAITATAGAVLGAYALDGVSFHYYYPSEWKGQVPKDIMTKRILAKLSRDELALVHDVGAKTHNVVDGIGIGLKYLGRL